MTSSKKKIKIFMFTSVHPWNDTRIFYKEAVSLAKKYEVELHAPADFDFKKEKGVKIYGLPKWKKRIDRIKTIREIWQRAKKSNANIFHFHDPELIPIGLLLKLKGKKVIYDVHEDVVKQIKYKEWLPRLLRFFFANLFSMLNVTLGYFFTLILAEFSYESIYKKYTKNYSILLNMPNVESLNKFVLIVF